MTDRRGFFGRLAASVLGLLGLGFLEKKRAITDIGPLLFSRTVSPKYLDGDGVCCYWTAVEISGKKFVLPDLLPAAEAAKMDFNWMQALPGFRVSETVWHYFPDAEIIKGIRYFKEA